jgi:hypothetical protein
MSSSRFSCAPALIGLALVGAAFGASADDGFTDVPSPELRLQLSAPDGWIVRRLTENGEHRVAITRELLEGFPRFHVGLTVSSADVMRRERHTSASTMARGVCQVQQKNGTATTPCRETVLNGLLRVDWQARFPPETGAGEGSVAWLSYLADDNADTLVTFNFETPESEWSALQSNSPPLKTKKRVLEQSAK